MAVFRAAYKKKKQEVRGGGGSSKKGSEPKAGKSKGSGKSSSSAAPKAAAGAAAAASGEKLKGSAAELPRAQRKKLAPYVGGANDEPVGQRKAPVLPERLSLQELRKCMPPGHNTYRDPANERSAFCCGGWWGRRSVATHPFHEMQGKVGTSGVVPVVCGGGTCASHAWERVS